MYTTRARRAQLLVVIGVAVLFMIITFHSIGRSSDIRTLPELAKIPVVLKSEQLKRQAEIGIISIVERNEDRLKWVEQTCQKYPDIQNDVSLGEVWASRRHSLAFCIVPKVGCTYWKRILRFLEDDYQNKATYPTDIDRYSVHYDKLTHINQFFVDNPDHREVIRPGIKFMFSRDPYARLWSAYLDKFYLPDFWHYARPVTIEMRTRTFLTSDCGYDVTFEEFIHYNYNHRNDQNPPLNEHFHTVVYNCNPCKLKFDVVGKAETFKADTDLVLANVGKLGDVPEDATLDRVADEVKSLIDYNLNIQEERIRIQKIPPHCFENFDISRRLWKVFQYNGYVSDDINFPEEKFRQLKTTNEFIETLVNDIMTLRKEATAETLQQWKTQREKSMHEAFKQLPKHLLEKFQAMYKIDFELFQYDPFPDWLNS